MVEASSRIPLISKTRNKLDLQSKRDFQKSSQVGKNQNKFSTTMFSQNTFLRTERLKEDGNSDSCQIQLKRLLDSQIIIKEK